MNRPRQNQLFSEDELPANLEAWEVAASVDQLIADVVFNRPLTTIYQYIVPEGLRDLIGPGQRVQVPFGRGDKLTDGYCVGLQTTLPAGRTLKTLATVLDREPLIDSRMLTLTRWIADRYLCGWGQVLETVIPKGVKTNAGTRDITFYVLAERVRGLLGLASEPAVQDTGAVAPAAPADVAKALDALKLRAKQRTVLEVLIAANRPMPVDEISKAADCGVSPIQSLREKELIVPVRERVMTPLAPATIEAHRELVMNPDQMRAVNSILEVVQSRKHRTMLLHGVTGSGKTEVYIRAIQEIVSYGRQAIMLVPEISLTPQTIRRFRSRFSSVAVLHSHLTDSERHSYWKQIASGDVQVVVGARSAIFAPTPHLGMIVIDEEHETSFKQDNTPRYHAREVARHRAEIEQIPLILGSATPTLESWNHVIDGRDTLLSMPRRVEDLPLPPVVIVDTRNDAAIGKGSAIGRNLFQAMNTALKDGGQVILFLNVRGFAPVLWCRGCGQGVKCADCDVTLTWHKQKAIALCHSCNFSIKPPAVCPECGRPGLAYLGLGTERLEHEVQARFADYRCLRMDSDTMQKRGAHDEALEKFRHGDVQILLGTQMIAKGLDFPNVTLVGVIDADTLLHQPDLRSAERTFQLIAQVAGRTGRSHRGGRVLVQTGSPTQYAITRAAQHDYLGFAKEELAHRRALKVPPYAHLARVILRGPKEEEVREYAAKVGELMRVAAKDLAADVKILGPAPCPVTRLKANFRYHLQLAASEVEQLRLVWLQAAPQFPSHPNVEYQIDVDPLNFR
ncbi:replication restart helicase PriA [Schlesneria paludicola]|uniref:replication restart helicase PriA n=1 Tax=Schlesneria paludicola TaxID=360056 RepID=UPI00029A4B6C|nr:primosomal protein N' [Schlesneria paludicola]